MKSKLLAIEVTEDFHRETKQLAKRHGLTVKALVLKAL
jgi:hypothetical protein